MSEPSTPLMRQYAAIKKEHPNALLFFRLGDFYELFFDDAVLAARELQITLTSRNKEKGVDIPMCGVPYHAAEGYIAKLIRRGFKVAVCEQVEDPRLAKKVGAARGDARRYAGHGGGFVAERRGEQLSGGGGNGREIAWVLRRWIFRPASFARPSLPANRPDAAFKKNLNNCGQKKCSMGLRLRCWNARDAIGCQMRSFASARTGETPVPHTGTAPVARVSGGGWAETPLDDWIFAPDHAIPLLENHFGVLSLEGFGLAGKQAAASAAGAILYYIRSTQRGTLDHVDRIGFYERQNCLVLDAVTVRNLELIEPLFAGTDAGVTLFRCLDATVTPMGKRLLRTWMLRPSLDRAEIEGRLDAVEVQVKDTVRREELRRALDGILDLERLLSRVTLETANPRDVLALAASLGRIPKVRAVLAELSACAIGDLAWIDRRTGRSAGEDRSHAGSRAAAHAERWRRDCRGRRQRSRRTARPEPQLEAIPGASRERERERTGIGSLKVKFNSIFGYYIEISKANLHLSPADYERKQTLVNAERFTTPELKEYESKILDAQEKIVEIERRLFAELRSAIAAEAKRIRQTALALAEVDVLGCLAHIAALRNYCRPRFDEAEKAEDGA